MPRAHSEPWRRPVRHAALKRLAALATVAVAFLAVRPLVKAPGHLLAACAKWISVAAGLELLSVAGFVLVFGLVFDTGSGRQPGLGAGLRALGAIVVLPAGGVVGPALAVRTSSQDALSVRHLARATVVLTILTNAPEVAVLGLLSVSLWLGWPAGPHDPLLTLPAAAGAAGAVLAVMLIGRKRQASSPQARRSGLHKVISGLAVLGDGAAETRALLRDRNWRLAGAVAYYAFDNAVLWAAFQATGGVPPVSVIVMGYVIGSLGTALPLPAGIGAVDGGMFGALVLFGAPAGPAAGAVLLYRGVSVSLPVIVSAAAWLSAPAGALRARVRQRGGLRPAPPPHAGGHRT